MSEMILKMMLLRVIYIWMYLNLLRIGYKLGYVNWMVWVFGDIVCGFWYKLICGIVEVGWC